MFDEHGNMTRTWIIFFERLGKVESSEENETAIGPRKATFGLVRELTVENDLTLHFIARSPGTFIDIVANGKQPCTGSAARIVIQKSTDEGVTWATIFKSPGYITLPADDDTLLIWTKENDDIFAAGDAGKIAAGDLLRINCTQKGSTFAGKGYEVVLRWQE